MASKRGYVVKFFTGAVIYSSSGEKQWAVYERFVMAYSEAQAKWFAINKLNIPANHIVGVEKYK